MKSAVLSGELRGVRRTALGEAWKPLKRMPPLISTARIDELYDLEMRNDALGGKVTGASGGGSTLFYCDFRQKHRVIKACERAQASCLSSLSTARD